MVDEKNTDDNEHVSANDIDGVDRDDINVRGMGFTQDFTRDVKLFFKPKVFLAVAPILLVVGYLVFTGRSAPLQTGVVNQPVTPPEIMGVVMSENGVPLNTEDAAAGDTVAIVAQEAETAIAREITEGVPDPGVASRLQTTTFSLGSPAVTLNMDGLIPISAWRESTTFIDVVDDSDEEEDESKPDVVVVDTGASTLVPMSRAERLNEHYRRLLSQMTSNAAPVSYSGVGAAPPRSARAQATNSLTPPKDRGVSIEQSSPESAMDTDDEVAIGTPLDTAAKGQQIAQGMFTTVYAHNLNALNSDVPGDVVLEIISTGPMEGARLRASYELLEWTELVRLRASEMTLKSGDSVPVDVIILDPETTLEAVSGEIDHHYLSRYGWWGLGTMLSSISAGITSYSSTTVVDNGTIVQSSDPLNTREKALVTAGEFGSEVAEILKRNLSRPITYTKEPYQEMGVFFMSDVFLPKVAEYE